MTSPYPAASTPDTSVHTAVRKTPKTLSPALFEGLILELFGALAIALAGVSVFGVHPLGFLQAWGQSLEAQGAAAVAGANNAQTTANTANTKGDDIIAALVAGLTPGASTTSSNPASILTSLLSQGLAIPTDILAAIFGQQASTQAQVNALASGGFSYDPAVNGVTGWSNLVGTLALSSRGAYIQATTETVVYRSSGLSVDKYGVNFVLDSSMRGVAGAGICADSAGASWVGLLAYRGFDGDALWLVTAASPTLWVVQKQADFSGANRFSGIMNLSLQTDGVSKFSVLYNNKPVPALADPSRTDWDDGGLATHNSSHRGVILLSNGLNSSVDGSYGPAIKGKVVSYAA